MKRRAEIIEKIKQIRQWRDNSPIVTPALRERHKQACNLLIFGLRFALGYKIGSRYWCIKCAYPHKNVRCPKCGNSSLMAVKGQK